VPRRHFEFLAKFEDVIEVGDYAFVHAGVRPGVPLAKQRSRDLRWIRHEFLDHAGSFGRVIVHGHTISKGVEWRANRIGIDTGAYASGKLTALGLERDTRWHLST
jgi:serine/threonine protein phosphatase 1